MSSVANKSPNHVNSPTGVMTSSKNPGTGGSKLTLNQPQILQPQFSQIPVITTNSASSFAYGANPLGNAQSPTISLLSTSSPSASSSQSPTSQSSSPTNMLFKLNTENKSKQLQQQQQQQLLLAKTAQMNSFNNANQNKAQQSLADGSNGVACQVVKSNTNIYYNLKVDTGASKAIHYCDSCTNPDCKAVHRSLNRAPLEPSAENPLVGATGLARSKLINNRPFSQHLQPLGSGNTGGLTRIFLAPTNLQQSSQLQGNSSPATLVPNSPNSIVNNSSQSTGTNSNNNNNNNSNRLSNINFIFERRYPLVQLNSNFINSNNAIGAAAAAASGTSVAPASPNSDSNSLRSISPTLSSSSHLNNNTGNNRLLLNRIPMTTNAAAAAIQNHLNRALGLNGHHISNSSTSEDSIGAFPLPVSPSSSLHHAVQQAAALAQQAHQSATLATGLDPKAFSINFNRLPTAPRNNSSNNENSQQSEFPNSPNSANSTTTPQNSATPTNNNNSTGALNENVFNFNFPSLIADLNKLRYRNAANLFDKVRTKLYYFTDALRIDFLIFYN
jgi:hypothetical protein